MAKERFSVSGGKPDTAAQRNSPARSTSPAPTYARYERQPESPECKIPMGAAWQIADTLGCSIDVVVGRASDEQERGGRIQSFYDSLSKSSRSRIDEYMSFIEYRERMVEAQGRWQ